ncbi:MAG: pirin family protein [Sphingobacteriales bacterium]|nr:MAG: pirin family protein [Sphingobacteriales bacterium]
MTSTASSVYHPAGSRGAADHGWLQAKHTFSFGQYHESERMHFGVLRVLNDDIVAPGAGFSKHPHDNMEIITIPLRGQLAHKDSLGNGETIHAGEIQIMSAGTGIEHSEFNPSHEEAVNLLQIWVFPNRRNVEPRYQTIPVVQQDGQVFQQIVSPNPQDAGGWIHQNAWFHLANLKAGGRATYELHEEANGVYVFVISGSIEIEGQVLTERDGFGIWSVESFEMICQADARVLLMEVPMGFE